MAQALVGATGVAAVVQLRQREYLRPSNVCAAVSSKRQRVFACAARCQKEQDTGTTVRGSGQRRVHGEESEGTRTTEPFSLLSVAPLVYPLIAEEAGYSQASYYTSLGLFLLSLPGLWSLIKRSAKSKVRHEVLGERQGVWC